MEPALICGTIALAAIVTAVYFFMKSADTSRTVQQQADDLMMNRVYAVLALLVAACCGLYVNNTINDQPVAVPSPTTSLLKSPESL